MQVPGAVLPLALVLSPAPLRTVTLAVIGGTAATIGGGLIWALPTLPLNVSVAELLPHVTVPA